MSTTADLVVAIKRELKAAQITYADLAPRLGLTESAVKRMFARGEMPLSRVDAICRALRIDLAELVRRMNDALPRLTELTEAQERAIVADRTLLLVAICVLSQWSAEQIVAAYRVSEAEVVRALARLDRLGVIELMPGNRYRLKLARTFRWRADGPVMRFFREHAVQEYFGGGFNGPAECLLLVHGSIGRAHAGDFPQRLQQLGAEFAQRHQADQKLPAAAREGYTLVLAMRRWEFTAFEALRR